MEGNANLEDVFEVLFGEHNAGGISGIVHDKSFRLLVYQRLQMLQVYHTSILHVELISSILEKQSVSIRVANLSSQNIFREILCN